MTKTELIDKLEQIFDGDPWHGPSLSKQLSSLDSDDYMTIVLPGKKSMAHVLEHMISWKRFAVEKLRGNESFDIELNSKLDWPSPQPTGNPKQYYLKQLNEVHVQLITLLNEKNEAWLAENTANKSYTNLYLMQGIVEHDLYHLGQIGIFNALVNFQKSSN